VRSQHESEIVCPLTLKSPGRELSFGVLNLDCLAQGSFGDDDKAGLEKIAKLDSCD